MAGTDELRKLLDERGVEYYLLDESIVRLTMWQTCYEGLRHECQFDERHGESKLEIWDCTPEQAIAATLGRGACRSTTPDDAWCFACSECGKSFPRDELHLAHNHGEINYCPNCGWRVKGGAE